MSQNDKKPEADIFAEIRKDLEAFGKDFKEAARETIDEIKQGADEVIDHTMRGAHFVKNKVSAGYQHVENKVGRDRLWGAGFGAKAGGIFAATKPHPFYVLGVGAGAVVGGIGGFLAGPYLAKRYNMANGMNDATSNDNATTTQTTSEPKPKEPGL